jgi:hypothetical protein
MSISGLDCEFVRPTAQYGTAISIAKIFYWSIEPKIMIMSLLAPTDQQISKLRDFLLIYSNRSMNRSTAEAVDPL